MLGKKGAGDGNTSQPQEQKSLQCIQKEIDDLKQKFKDVDPINDSIDSKDLEEEKDNYAEYTLKASTLEKKAKYQKSHDLIQQRITLNKLRDEAIQRKEEFKDDVESLNMQLKQLEEDISFKLSLKNLTNNSLRNLLKKQQEEGKPDAKENAKKIIEQLQVLKNKFYQMMNDEGLETIEEELNKQINEYEHDLQKIDKIKRNNDYTNKQRDIANYKTILSLYQQIKQIVSQEIKSSIPQKQSIEIVTNSQPMPKDSEFLEIYDEIKYYKFIPEGCFEKILAQASYALYLRNNQVSDENFLKIQEVLKDDPIILLDEQNLDLIIINAAQELQKRYNIERISNPEILSQLKQIPELIDVQNKEQLLVTKNILKNILSKFRKFHMEKFFDYVEEVNKVALTIANKDIYFFMGTTGCGKSTTIQYLCQSEMYQTFIDGLEHIGFRNVKNIDLLEVSCSPFARSKTRFIKKIDTEINGKFGQVFQYTLVDSPGLFDTQSIEIEVSNQYGIQKAICGSKSVRPIIILSMKKFGDRGQDIKKILSFYANMIKDQSYLNEFDFFITHSQDKTINDVGTLFVEYKKSEEEKTQNKDEGVIKFLEVMIQKAGANKIPFINPLKSEEILTIFQNIQGKITKPYNVFKQALLPQANKCIKDQFQIHINEIDNEFKSQQCDKKYVIYKLDQLKKFKEIFPQQDYISQYEDCLFELIRILNENYSQATNIISDSLLKNKNLIDKDIEIVKSNLIFADNREEIRKKFLININKENEKIISPSYEKMINEFCKQIEINKPKLIEEKLINEISQLIDQPQLNEEKLKIDSKDVQNYFGKLELIVQLNNPQNNKIKEARDSCIKELIQILDQKQTYFSEKIRNLNLDLTTKDENKKFFQELAVFINQILNSVQNYSANEIKKKLEDLHSIINSLLQEKFDDFEELIKEVLKLSEKTQQDMQNLRQLQLPDLLSQTEFQMDKSLIKNCKNYFEFFDSFSFGLRISQKLELYLQTEERIKKFKQCLSYWVFIQEVVLQKYILDPNTQLDKISRVYKQVKDLLAEKICHHEAEQRILTININLKSLVDRRQNEIRDMLPQFQDFIQGKQSKVNDYTMLNLKEAVRTIKQLKWIMESDDKDLFKENIETIKEFLQILVQTIQEQVRDCRLDTEKTDDFKKIRLALKQIDDITLTAKDLEIELENSFYDQFKKEIMSSIQAIDSFVNRKKISLKEKKLENQYSLLERHEFKRMDDYVKYLNEIRQNKLIIQSIDKQIKKLKYDEIKKIADQINIDVEEKDSLNQYQKNIVEIKIQNLSDEMDHLIRCQPYIIYNEFKQNLKKIQDYNDIMLKTFKDKKEQLLIEKSEEEKKDIQIQQEKLFYELTDEYLKNPTNCIEKYFRIFRLYKTNHNDLWKKVGLSNNVDDIIYCDIICLQQEYHHQIMQAHNVSQEQYNKLRVLSYMRILDQFLDRPHFEDSYNTCSEKINKYQGSIENRIKHLIDEQRYNDIIETLYQQQQMKQFSSQDNIRKIKYELKKKCNYLCNVIEKGCRKYDDFDISKFKEKKELEELNNKTKELMLMIYSKHEDLKFSNIKELEDEFKRSESAIKNIYIKFQSNDKQNKEYVESLINRNKFKNAYIKIQEQRKLLQIVDIDDQQQEKIINQSTNDQKQLDWPKLLEKNLQEKLLNLHLEFQKIITIIAENLIFLQTLSNVDMVKIKCSQQISQIIEEIDKIRQFMDKSNDQAIVAQSDFMFDVANLLKQNSEGSKILQKYPQFEGIRRAIEFDRYPKQGVEYVLNNLEFHDGDQIVKIDKTQKDELLTYYKQFNDFYTGYVNEYLGPIQLVENNLLQLKTKVYALTRRNQVVDKKILDDIPEVIALLFAIFTIQDSVDVLHKIKNNGNFENGEKYLLKPHAGQIICLLRILGLGHPQIKTQKINYHSIKTNQINKYIGKNSIGQQLIFDNLAQIKTGEGKSYTLGILSSIFALWGFDVNCASYSQYLSQRDFDTFTKFFELLDVKKYIQYSTFNTICENYLNQNGDIRKIIIQRILKNPQEQIQMIEQENQGKIKERDGQELRPQILLIDEVDVFFCSNFFGQMFSPTARIRCQQVTQLLDYIWSERDNKITFSKLQNRPEYLNCQALFNPEYNTLFDASCKDMLYEVQNYQDHGYLIENEMIGYLYNDQISYQINHGYKTTFANYHEYQKGNISQESYNNCKSIQIQCMQFSYSEVPIQFALTLGVTGTLSALSASELDIVRKTFHIQNFTYIPSVYGESNLDWERRENRIQILNKDFYYQHIIREINDNLQSQRKTSMSFIGQMMNKIQQNDHINRKNRAVIVFFENEAKLQEFRKSKLVQNKINHKTLTEKMSNKDKENTITEATYPLQVTFATPGFGRGTDFICRDQDVEKNGGLHVILTFMCTQHSEFVQIQGRTARQGNKGSFSMVLLDEDLKKFNLSLLDKDFTGYEEVKGDPWEVLQQKRDEMLKIKKFNELVGIAEIKNWHNKSMEIKNIINDPKNNSKICEYLLSINKDKQFNGTPVRTLILMDATGSMTNLLQKAKNSVAIMFEQTSVILKDNIISPEMIQIQFAVYRNYSSPVNQLLQHSPWESNPLNLRNFMNQIEVSGGIFEEAVEVGLQHAVYEANQPGIIPLSQVFLIGDAPPNPPSQIAKRRENEDKWKGTKFETQVQWDQESVKLASKNIPVHTFYVEQWAKNDFKKIADMTKGTCQFLDVNDQEKGQQMLIEMFSKQLLQQIGASLGENGLGDKMVKQFIQRFN